MPMRFANQRPIGQRIPRLDALDAVTGRALFGADLRLPNMLYGRILRSPYAHGRIKSIDVSRALQLPGVHAIITAADVPPGGKVFAREFVHHVGDKVAAVAADTLEIADRALNLIDVKYELLPAAIDPVEAMQPDAPMVQDELPCAECYDERGRKLKNIAGYDEFTEGDVLANFADADAIVEATFRTPTFNQCYLEPHVSTAMVDSSGRIIIWSSGQGIFFIRNYVARALKLPLHKIKVIGMRIGGGFGGKNYMHNEAVAALLAMKTKRPVQVVDTRYDVFVDGRPGPGSVTFVRAGARRDGTLLALQATVIWDAGAYGYGYPETVLRLRGLYRWCSFHLRGYTVYTNKVNPGAYRAPNAPQMAFVRESIIDMLARKLNIDPLELRLRNAVEKGDVSIDGNPLPRIAFKETLRAAAEKSNWGKPLGKNRGRGIACGEWHHIVGASAAYVMLNQDGTVQVVTGSVDLTGTNTLFAQIVAEELSVPINAITVTVGDTDTVPFHHLTAGSRTTYATGTAVRRAARVARQKILAIAATELGVDANALELVDGKVRMRDNPEHTLTLAEVAELSIRNARGAIIGTATLADMPRRPVYSVHVVEIEIDPFTGIVTPLRIVAAQDVGRQLNPLLLEGQIQGGVVQALGYAMMEGAKYAPDGRMLNASFSDYPIPTAMDAPRIEHVIVEVPSPHGPYGAVGAGEPPMIPTAAAIANAIDDAIGVRVTELPITPERVIVAQRLNATKRT